MKAAVIFTGSGPILVLTTYESLDDPSFIEKLAQKGIKKFIGQEVSVEMCKEKYGAKFEAVKNDVKESDDLRVLDYDGVVPVNVGGPQGRVAPGVELDVLDGLPGEEGQNVDGHVRRGVDPPGLV